MARHIKQTALALGITSILAIGIMPVTSLAGPADSINARAKAIKGEFDRCVRAAKQNTSKIKQCEASATSKLAALRGEANGLAGDDKQTSLQLIASTDSSIRSSSRQAISSAQPEPEELMAEEAESAPRRDSAKVGSGASTRAPVRKREAKRSSRKYRKAKRRPSPKAIAAPRRPAPRPTAPPRDVSSNTESYTDHGVNKMTETSEDNLSTFSIDVDTGAYVIARRKINAGGVPPKASVRVEEFVNYFRYDYARPKKGPFAVDLEAAPSPFTADKNTYLMRVGVQGKALGSKERKPVHLTFLVDVSGSMNRPDKLGLAQESLKILTNNLKEGDTVALVTYAGNTRVVLEPTGMYERGKIHNAIMDLRAAGGTAMGTGMDLAYKQALANHKRGHVNRVIVLSDGDTNIGPTNQDELFGAIKKYVDEGVTLSMIGVGMGNYKDNRMEQLANKGNGNYYYIDTIKEARKVFGDQLDGTLQVIAKDVKIQVDFEKKSVKSYRLIGYENRDIADKDFRDDKVDAGEIGAGHTVTALYEIVLQEKPTNTLATVRIRHKKPEGAKASESAFKFTRSDTHTKLSDASRDFQFAAAVTGFAEILRESPYAKDLNLALIKEIAQSATRPEQLDRVEFIELVDKTMKIKK